MQRPLPLAAIAVPALTLFFVPSASAQKKSQYQVDSFRRYSQIAGAARVGADTCSTCHTEIAGNFKHAFHAQQAVECEDCHGPGSLHVESSGDVSKILGFRARPVAESNGVCLSCHTRDQKLHNWFAGRHAANRIRCTECHQVHARQDRPAERARFDAISARNVTRAETLVPESMTLVPRGRMNDLCLRCHQAQRAQMSLPYHHPLREAKMTCVDCHDPHGGGAGKNLRMANVNQLCLECHAQYRGPFTYQHPPVSENCMICHAAHGSPNPNLVTVSQPALCLQCHAGHHDGASLPLVDRCTNCHGSIHGSDVPTPTGGSRFVDKGGLGVPGFAQPALSPASAARSFAVAPMHATTASMAAARLAHAGYAPAGWARTATMIPFAVLPGAISRAFPGASSLGPGGPAGPAAPENLWGLSFSSAYRFLNVSGYGGRVGEYDSLEGSAGGDFETDYVSSRRRLTFLARGTVLTGSDFHVASQFNLGELLDLKADLRSFVQQQDNYPFYAGQISPDIGTTDTIDPGSTFSVTRRLGDVSARLKVPKLPVHVFAKGSWQAREGHTQLTYLDENIDTTCSTCHFTSRLQGINYTTRSISAGVEVHVGAADLTWEHRYSRFGDRLPFPSAALGPMLNEVEPVPVFVPDTPAGTYYLDVPSPNEYSADSLRLNWTASPDLLFNGQVTYRRARNTFTRNPQNALDADATLTWRALERLRITADYRQQNLLNDFVPYFALYGNVSYHQHWAGVRLDYELGQHLDVETYYRRSGITRSNAFLWPQIYSINNTDLQRVVPSSFSNTAGLALHYHGGAWWGGRAGYEFTGTHAPGYLTEPGGSSRVFGNLTLTPAHWLVLTNDVSVIVQNAFPVIQRRNRFYAETADAILTAVPNWNLDLGYSYQQNNLATYMAFQNDASAGYVLDEPFVPYRQLSQTWWVRSAYTFRKRLGVDLSITHNSAHSGMRPNLNPNDYLVLGNGTLADQGVFDPVLFQQALAALALGATQVSQVNVPELIGQGRLHYLLPRGFDAGLRLYYGSYRDYTNPGLNGIMRAYDLYVGRSW
jgi:predicted CXXCH cytochrome family protein